MSRRLRLDAELVRRGLARSREQAAELIAAGRVAVGGQAAAKAATQVGRDAAITVGRTRPSPDYASRGGRKLEGALAAFGGLAVAGRRCLDAGASTGGFTDVLLRAGAAQVVAVDVGYGQLAWSLRTDPRVTVLDRVNVRELTPEQVAPAPGLVTADLSFISLTLVLPALAACAAPDADFVLLVKPQFEVGKGNVGAGGVVRDPALRAAAVGRSRRRPRPARPGRAGVAASPLPGPVRERGVFPVAAPRGAAAGRGRPARRRSRKDRSDSRERTHAAGRAHRAAGRRVRSGPRWSSARLTAAGVAVRVLEPEAADLGCRGGRGGAGLAAAARRRGDGAGDRRRRHAAARGRAGPAAPGCRCSGSTSATSASWPRPSRRTCPRRSTGSWRESTWSSSG